MSISFVKMHGIGNDYVYMDATRQAPADPAALAVRLSDRHTGVGGDGLVLILPSDRADFRMRMFNADGSEGKMCGNASRCIGKYVYEMGLTDRTDLTLETLSGIRGLHLHLQGKTVDSVTVDMGQPELCPERIPAMWPGERMIDIPYTVSGREYRLTALSMGNPHCVIFTDAVESLPLEQIGPMFEHLPLFPDRVNTEFVHQTGADCLRMRVWERGSGETLACGTGACAAAVAAMLTGRVCREAPVTVCLRGGELVITWRADGMVTMTGSAQFVFRGEMMD